MSKKKLSPAQIIRREELADNLKYYMKLRGITGRDLSAKTNIPTQTISHVRTGRGTLTVERVEKVASALNCKPEELDPGYIVKVETHKNSSIFSQNLQKLMIKNHEKDADLSKAIEYALPTITKWKNDTLKPSDQAIYRIADHYKVSPRELTGGDFKFELDPTLNKTQKAVLSHLPEELSEENLDKLISYIKNLNIINDKEKEGR